MKHIVSIFMIILLRQLSCTAQVDGVVMKYTGDLGKSEVTADVEIIDTIFSGHIFSEKINDVIQLKGSVESFLVDAEATIGDSTIGNFSGRLAEDYSTFSGTFIGSDFKSSGVKWKSTMLPSAAT